ncbi:hypothetical protein ACLI4Y_01470 [Natrialbaceae archaeon A-CW3]
MQTLEVTDEQYAVIQRLRAAISSNVVGKYGFVREKDAVQFLIDNLDGDLETADLADADELGSTATDDVAAAVDAAIAGEEPAEEVESVSYDEGADVLDEDGESVEDDDSGAADEDEDSSDGDDESADDDGDESEESNDADDTDESDEDADSDDAVDSDDDESDDADDSEGADDADDSEGGAADDDDMLDRMMNLLETHDDKWEESPSGDYRYRVTLPDGSTDDVQTKDDVRALLFKNY